MSIEERILNDNSCSPYVDKGRGYVEIAFKDGAYWGYEQGCKDMIEKACEWLKNNWREYVYQDGDGIVHFGHWESDFRKAMEDYSCQEKSI